MKWVALDSCGPAKRSAAPKVKMFGSKLRASKRHNLRHWGIAWDLDPKSRAALKLPDAEQRKSKFAGLLGAGVSPGYRN